MKGNNMKSLKEKLQQLPDHAEYNIDLFQMHEDDPKRSKMRIELRVPGLDAKGIARLAAMFSDGSL